MPKGIPTRGFRIKKHTAEAIGIEQFSETRFQYYAVCQQCNWNETLFREDQEISLPAVLLLRNGQLYHRTCGGQITLL